MRYLINLQSYQFWLCQKRFFHLFYKIVKIFLKWLIFIAQSFCEVEGSERPDV